MKWALRVAQGGHKGEIILIRTSPFVIGRNEHCQLKASNPYVSQRGTFIGQESGGGYYGNTSGPVPALTLPNTKLVVYVPLVTYYMAVSGYKAAAHGVLPEHQIHYTIEELLEGTDKELALALKLARQE